MSTRFARGNWIGYILRTNCLLKQVIEGKIKGEMEVTRRSKIMKINPLQCFRTPYANGKQAFTAIIQVFEDRTKTGETYCSHSSLF